MHLMITFYSKRLKLPSHTNTGNEVAIVIQDANSRGPSHRIFLWFGRCKWPFKIGHCECVCVCLDG